MKKYLLQITASLLCLATLNGCMTMKPNDFKNKKPIFLLEEYFNGSTKAWGIFEDRFGNVKRQFTVDIEGKWDGNLLTLNETFLFSDGEQDFRQWRIRKVGNGRYLGRANDVIGTATGIASGNSLNWSYTLDLKMEGNKTMQVKFDDWMFLQPGNVLLNRARMSKFGIELGQVTISFSKKQPTYKERQSFNEKFAPERISATFQ